MTEAGKFLKKRISSEGAITIADFMGDALGHPKYGYYITRDPIGSDGDFTTAPEISQMFGELIGLWFVDNWQKLGCPDNFTLVELGPGRGTLMADILRAATIINADFIKNSNIILIETSPTLRAKQRHALKEYNITWHDNMVDIPPLPMILVANEFFDALPVRQLIKGEPVNGDGIWHERLVSLDDDGNFIFNQSIGKTAAMPLLNENIINTAKIGDIAEICPLGLSIAGNIGSHINIYGGLALIIDYGYKKSQTGDSLQAVKSHKFINPLLEIGEADLTCHVDFESLSTAFADSGAKPSDIITQGDFLRYLGIEQRTSNLGKNIDVVAKKNLYNDMARLIDKDKMGDLFKVLAVTSGG